uniref:Uncharacterized protein n=1 Tax=Lepeophtheirus salmonis TaxID=72036 RepID=A0A0K2TV26_LEPSM
MLSVPLPLVCVLITPDSGFSFLTTRIRSFPFRFVMSNKSKMQHSSSPAMTPITMAAIIPPPI